MVYMAGGCLKGLSKAEPSDCVDRGPYSVGLDTIGVDQTGFPPSLSPLPAVPTTAIPSFSETQ